MTVLKPSKSKRRDRCITFYMTRDEEKFLRSAMRFQDHNGMNTLLRSIIRIWKEKHLTPEQRQQIEAGAK